MKKLVFLSFVSILSFNALSQLKIGNNPTTINSNSILELESTNKGLLLPRVALQATNSASPLSSFVAGMIVYNTATAGDVIPGFYVSTGSSWTKIDNQTTTTLYNGNGSIPASTTRTVTFGSGSNLNFDANTLYIDGDQSRVGIGTSLPATKLDVTGGQIRLDTDYTLTINRSDNFTHNSKSMSHYGIGWFSDSWDNSGATSWLSGYSGIKLFTNGAARMAITRAGNIGIGTSSPSEKLDVTGNVKFSGALMPNNTAGTSGQVLTSAGAGAVPTWTTLPTVTTYIGSTSVTLNGTSFERAALTGDVTATANSNATTIANDAVTYAKMQNVSANNTLLGRATTGAGDIEEITLGTGLSLSGTTLSASSDLRLVNTTSHVTQDAGVGSNGSSAGGADNIMIGSGTGNSNSGTKNVFIGKEAGNANTTSTGSTFIGYQTGKSNTTGGANTYLGYQSGLSGITNSANTFVGYQSGNSNTGDNNNAFGYLALRQNTSGGGNAAFGTQSMMSNSTGFENTAFGTYTLFNNSTGYLNVASGSRSMMSNTTGNNNTANGYQSLTTNTTGSSNTAFGSQSLFSNSTGSNNVSIGAQSLQLSTSSNNIAVGFKAGDNITTGAKNLVIGYDIDAPSATSNNQLNIGNIIFGTNVDGTGTTVSTGNIGIGNTSPSEKLDVTGNVKFSGALMPNNTAGTSGQVLTSAGAGAVPTWTTLPTATTYSGSTSVTLNGTSFERAALTGDVTSAANSNSTTIATDAVTSTKILDGTIATADVANSAVTYAKIQNVSANNTLLGRATTGAGTVEEITLGTGLSLTGSTLNAAAATTLYNGDGSLSGNRTVTQGTNNLAFTSSASTGSSHFTVDGTTLNVDAVNNRIGIGTAAPASTLDVRGYGVFWNGTSGLAFGQAGYSDIHAIGTSNRLTINYGVDLSTDINFNSNADVTIVTGGTGKLGVGSFPTEKLDVNGNVKFSGALMPNNTAGTAGQVLTSAGAGAAPTWTTPSAFSTIYSADGTLSGNRTVTQGANTLAFTSTATNGFSVDGTTFSVDASNNRVGIGTNSPEEKLHIGVSGSNAIKIGNYGNANGAIFIGGGASTGVSNWLDFYNGTGVKSGNIFFDHTIGAFYLNNTATNTIIAAGAGNLGVGNNSPSQKLDVTGAIKFSGALMPNNTAGTSGQVLTSAGAGAVPTWTTLPTATTYTGSTSTILNGTSFERAALTGDVTATQNSNALTIATNAVTSAKIADGTITAADLNQMSATNGQIMKWNGTAWAAANDENTVADGSETVVTAGSGISISGTGTTASPYVINANAAIATVTADYTATSANNTILCNVPGVGMTLTLPSASANSGKVIVIRKIDNDSDILTFSPALNYSTTQTISTLNFVKTITVQSNGSSWWVITE